MIYFVSTFFFFVLSYLGTVFMTLEPNPLEWSEVVRVMYTFTVFLWIFTEFVQWGLSRGITK